jgi:hypothetical protein
MLLQMLDEWLWQGHSIGDDSVILKVITVVNIQENIRVLEVARVAAELEARPTSVKLEEAIEALRQQKEEILVAQNTAIELRGEAITIQDKIEDIGKEIAKRTQDIEITQGDVTELETKLQVEQDVEEEKRRNNKREGLGEGPSRVESKELATVRARLAAAGRSPEDIQMILEALQPPGEAGGQAKAKARPNSSGAKGASAAQEQTAAQDASGKASAAASSAVGAEAVAAQAAKASAAASSAKGAVAAAAQAAPPPPPGAKDDKGLEDKASGSPKSVATLSPSKSPNRGGAIRAAIGSAATRAAELAGGAAQTATAHILENADNQGEGTRAAEAKPAAKRQKKDGEDTDMSNGDDEPEKKDSHRIAAPHRAWVQGAKDQGITQKPETASASSLNAPSEP